MQCRSALTRIDALRTGELRREEDGVLKDHLSTCASCDESVDDVKELARAVKALRISPAHSLREVVKTDFFDQVNEVWVAFSDRAIRMVSARSFDEFRWEYARRYGRSLKRAPLPEALRRQMEAALSGRGVDKPHVDFGETTDLEREVLRMLTRIPRGEVRSYSWLAEQVGRPRAVRAVANVVARNVVPFLVPCHRVVPAGGGVGEYAYGSKMKRDLLQREGVDCDALEALAREGVRFIGSRTTKIFCFPTCRGARRIREDNRVSFHGTKEAEKKGFRPCRRCQPKAA